MLPLHTLAPLTLFWVSALTTKVGVQPRSPGNPSEVFAVDFHREKR